MNMVREENQPNQWISLREIPSVGDSLHSHCFVIHIFQTCSHNKQPIPTALQFTYSKPVLTTNNRLIDNDENKSQFAVYQSSSSSPNRPPPLISMSSSSSSSSSFASSFFSSAAGAAAPAAGAAAPPVGMDTSLSSPEAISSSTFFPSRSARSFSIFSSSLSAPTASRTDLMFSA